MLNLAELDLQSGQTSMRKRRPSCRRMNCRELVLSTTTFNRPVNHVKNGVSRICRGYVKYEQHNHRPVNHVKNDVSRICRGYVKYEQYNQRP